MSSQLGMEPLDTITFNCDKNECKSLKVDEKGNPIKLDVSGNVGVGTVTIDIDGNVSIKIENNGYCVYKYASNDKINIIKGNCETVDVVDDAIAPIITMKENYPIVTSNSIIIGYNIEENESGIKSVTCKYGESIDTLDKEVTNASISECAIKNLQSASHIYYEVCAIDNGENKTTPCLTGEADVRDINIPVIVWQGYNALNSKIESINGYVYKDEATITFDDTGVENAKYYIKTSVSVAANINAINCGTGEEPICQGSSENVTTLEANTWYQVTDNNVVITFNEQGSIDAYIYDESNNNGYASGSSRKIDRTGPILTINSISSTMNKITISYEVNDIIPTTIKCEYGTNENYGMSVNGSNGICEITNVTGGKYYYKVTATDGVGNMMSKQGETNVATYYDALEVKNNPVYYNPNTNSLCTEADYKANLKSQKGSETASPTEIKEGCMKWYKYSDNNDGTVNMILAHNTTSGIGFSSTSIDNTKMIAEIKDKMNNDTSSWQVKARSISANEIAGIVGIVAYDETTATINDRFYFGSKTIDIENSKELTSKYSWLFDYTGNCINSGCEIDDSSNYGYWTGSPLIGYSTSVWNVSNTGRLGYDNATIAHNGLRPVITISKKIVEPIYYDALEVKNNPVYYNPNTNSLCNEADYKTNLKAQKGSETASPIGIKEGCMKWYKYRDNNDGTINMILAHNTTASISFSDTSIENTQMITEIKDKMNNDTSSWQVKARPISANEIAGITGNSSFNESISPSNAWFYFGSKTQVGTNADMLNTNYSWLFDYTNDCKGYGCEIADSSCYGYWTGSFVAKNSTEVWLVHGAGRLSYRPAEDVNYALRPVITMSKTIFE